MEIVEYAITVRSTHAAPHLVILSEYLPHVGEEGIKVELLKPSKEEILQVIFTAFWYLARAYVGGYQK